MTKNYLSPLVCCITCKEVRSEKGLFSHFLIAHTDKGKLRAKTNGKLRNKLTSEHKNIIAANRKREQYANNPTTCITCSSNLPYQKRKNKYCSRSCSAKANNPNRTCNTGPQPGAGAFTKIVYCVCVECNTQFRWDSVRKGHKKYCSSSCEKQHNFERRSTHAKAIGFGGVRQSKKIEYKGVKLGSTFELTLALILDRLSIVWEQPKKMHYVNHKGKHSTYAADFYLPEYNLYLDPKNNFLIHNKNPGNGLRDVDKIAFVVEQNKVTIAIIDALNLTEKFVKTLVGQEGFEPSVILSCKDSGFDHSHHCPIVYL